MATSHCAHIRSARDPTGSSRHGRHLQRVWVQYIPAGQVPKADHTVRQRIDSSSTASASSRRRHLYPASLEMESDGVIEAMLEQTAPTVNAGHAMIPSREEVDELNASKDSTTYQKNVRRLQHSR